MKKVLSLLAIVTLFTFVACNNAATTEETNQQKLKQAEDQSAADKMEEAAGHEDAAMT